ncbi:phage major capsid protein [Mycolicibacterium baixiangningiae]|uniref:phage major capsid protein n=1 Tax=Mycolicibacterium baixiangningiae TaxID=2761578 RepID=UPI0018D10611|nr:phage major capsid protein [Mycolicibacterium baixiangningiae]
MSQSMYDRYMRLLDRHDELTRELGALGSAALVEVRDWTPAEQARAEELNAELDTLGPQITELVRELKRAGYGNPGAVAARTAQQRVSSHTRGDGWAARAAAALLGGGERRAVTSGSVDLPTLVEPTVSAKPRPGRLIDLLVNRQVIDAPAYVYVRQSVRTNNATAVADFADKPTSVSTGVPVEDRPRVIAHLSENVPIRYWQDHTEVIDWLNTEMVEGVLDALEAQVIRGNGTGENMEGLLTVTGTTAVAYTADVATTLRKAVTALQVLGVAPNAWVLNPADAEAVDLLRFNWGGEGAAAAGFLLDGFQSTNAGSGNVFGGNDIQRVVSNSVPAGTAVLGDWSKLKLYIRETTRLDYDASGDQFTNNTARIRAEGRFGVGHLMPSCFAKVDLTP